MIEIIVEHVVQQFTSILFLRIHITFVLSRLRKTKHLATWDHPGFDYFDWKVMTTIASMVVYNWIQLFLAEVLCERINYELWLNNY